MDEQKISETVEKLNELTSFAASTGEDKYMEIAEKLSRGVLNSVVSDKIKCIKASDIADIAIDKICCELKQSAFEHSSLGEVVKTLKIQNKRQKEFIDQAIKILEEDGFSIEHSCSRGEVYVEMKW